jgi:hypothetical protein
MFYSSNVDVEMIEILKTKYALKKIYSEKVTWNIQNIYIRK